MSKSFKNSKGIVRRAVSEAVETLETRVLLAGGTTTYLQNWDSIPAGTFLPSFGLDSNIVGSTNNANTYVQVSAAQHQSGANSLLLHDSPDAQSYYPQAVILHLGPAAASGFTTEAVDLSFDYWLPAVADQEHYFGDGLWFGPRNDANNVMFAETLIGGNGLYVKPGTAGGGYTGPVTGGAWHHVQINYGGITGGNTLAFTTQLDDLAPVANTVDTQGQNFWNQLAIEIRDNTGTHDVYLDNIDIHPHGAGTIAGTVFNDSNSNGIKDGAETGIVGWGVYLDTNNDNIKDAGETAAYGNGVGAYQFTDLTPGTYHVKQILQAGNRKTSPGSGIPGYDVVIAGATVQGKDFGNTSNILLAGKVFNDVNSNGKQDAGEAGLAGFVVDIKSNNATVASRTTDANGAWQVKGLAAGTGSANVQIKAGYSATQPVGGLYEGSMSSGQQNANLNFGLHASGPAPAAAVASSSILSGGFAGLNFFGDVLE